MTLPSTNPRLAEADVDAAFLDRWSPRAYRPDPVSAEEIRSLFEAARWAPSCYNDQPWIFHFARTEEDRQRYVQALADLNQAWAGHAPLLIFVAVRKNFRHNGSPNRHGAFDAGAAWMSLALQARRRGLHAHAMAGFSPDKAREILGLDEAEFDILAAVAVGRIDRSGDGPAETPNDRLPLAGIMIEGCAKTEEIK